MAFSEFRDTYSWKGAIELGPHLARLADELPAGEQMGLALQLREGMVNLAGGIGLDILDGGSFTRRRHAVRLLATLDLVDHIYPALDTGAARDALDKLLERLTGPDFDQHKSGKPRTVAPAPRPELPHPAPESVPVIPDAPTPAAPTPPLPPHQVPAHESNPALKIAVSAEPEDHPGQREG